MEYNKTFAQSESTATVFSRIFLVLVGEHHFQSANILRKWYKADAESWPAQRACSVRTTDACARGAGAVYMRFLSPNAVRHMGLSLSECLRTRKMHWREGCRGAAAFGQCRNGAALLDWVQRYAATVTMKSAVLWSSSASFHSEFNSVSPRSVQFCVTS